MDVNSLLKTTPKDILRIVVLDYLKPLEIVVLCRTARYFNTAICKNPHIWKSLYQRDLSATPLLPGKSYELEYKKAFGELPLDQIDINAYGAFHGYEKLIHPIIIAESTK